MLYGINTLGAVAGIMAATFWSMEFLGTRRTLWIAAALNAAVAAIAYSLSRTVIVTDEAPKQKTTPAAAEKPARMERKGRRHAAMAKNADAGEDDVLELDEPLAPPADLGPPLLDEDAAGHTRDALSQLTTVAASVPASSVNPLEDMVREMLRPVLKQWLDEHLPRIVDEHVKREISRITGRPL